MTSIQLRIWLHDGEHDQRLDVVVSPYDLLAEVIERIVAHYKLPGTAAEWGFYHNRELVNPHSYAEFYQNIELVFHRHASAPPKPQPPVVQPSPKEPSESTDLPADDELFEVDLSDDQPLPGVRGAPQQTPPQPAPAPAPAARSMPPSVRSIPTPVPVPKQSPKPASRGSGSVVTYGHVESRQRETEDDQAPLVKRRATVRYYSRMNPQRSYPFLVILSAEQIAEIVKKRVQQTEGTSFEVKAGSQVEIEPILPGCQCYPPRETITIGTEAVTAEFWVVPLVLGAVPGARVVVRQAGVTISEVKLEMKVSKQTLAVVFGVLGLVSPYFTMGLKQLKLDPASQKEENFELYRQVGWWIVEHLRPEFLGFGMLGLAALCYVWFRPRQRDVFWDITPKPLPSKPA